MEFIQTAPAEAFVLSEANGGRSRDEITLKQDAAPYLPGALVVAEPDVNGNPSSVYVPATAESLTITTVKLAIVLRFKDATAGNVRAAGFVRDGQVKGQELVLYDGLTINDVDDMLAEQGIIVRDAI